MRSVGKFSARRTSFWEIRGRSSSHAMHIWYTKGWLPFLFLSRSLLRLFFYFYPFPNGFFSLASKAQYQLRALIFIILVRSNGNATRKPRGNALKRRANPWKGRESKVFKRSRSNVWSGTLLGHKCTRASSLRSCSRFSLDSARSEDVFYLVPGSSNGNRIRPQIERKFSPQKSFTLFHFSFLPFFLPLIFSSPFLLTSRIFSHLADLLFWLVSSFSTWCRSNLNDQKWHTKRKKKKNAKINFRFVFLFLLYLFIWFFFLNKH